MKRRKNYLHTKFIEFLLEDEKLQKIEDEVESDEVDTDDIENNEDTDDATADIVIEKLVQKLIKSNKEFDDIICGQK